MSEDTKAKVIRLKGLGLDQRTIASRLGLGTATVSRILQEHGHKPQSKGGRPVTGLTKKTIEAEQ